MSVKSPKSDLTSEIGIYLLVAELLHLEIDKRLHSVLTESDTLALFQKLDSECSAYLSGLLNPNGFEQAAVDFCDQFILPESKSVPRAAGWMDMEQTMLIDKVVSQFLNEWKIELPESYRHLAFDHISLILYVSSVIRQEDAAQAAEFDAATLFPWVTRLGDSLVSSPVSVYRALGEILKQLPET